MQAIRADGEVAAAVAAGEGGGGWGVTREILEQILSYDPAEVDAHLRYFCRSSESGLGVGLCGDPLEALSQKRQPCRPLLLTGLLCNIAAFNLAFVQNFGISALDQWDEDNDATGSPTTTTTAAANASSTGRNEEGGDAMSRMFRRFRRMNRVLVDTVIEPLLRDVFEFFLDQTFDRHAIRRDIAAICSSPLMTALPPNHKDVVPFRRTGVLSRMQLLVEQAAVATELLVSNLFSFIVTAGELQHCMIFRFCHDRDSLRDSLALRAARSTTTTSTSGGGGGGGSASGPMNALHGVALGILREDIAALVVPPHGCFSQGSSSSSSSGGAGDGEGMTVSSANALAIEALGECCEVSLLSAPRRRRQHGQRWGSPARDGDGVVMGGGGAARQTAARMEGAARGAPYANRGAGARVAAQLRFAAGIETPDGSHQKPVKQRDARRLSSGIPSIPVELQREMLLFLTPRALVCAITTCRIWHHLVKSSPVMRPMVSMSWAAGEIYLAFLQEGWGENMVRARSVPADKLMGVHIVPTLRRRLLQDTSNARCDGEGQQQQQQQQRERLLSAVRQWQQLAQCRGGAGGASVTAHFRRAGVPYEECFHPHHQLHHFDALAHWGRRENALQH